MTTQKQMYGVTEAQVLRDYREAERIYGEYMNLYIMAILSDRAREYLDRAKGE